MGITVGKDEGEGSQIVASSEAGAILTGMWRCLGLDQWQGILLPAFTWWEILCVCVGIFYQHTVAQVQVVTESF